ncbi:SepA family multidrug efflux transporter [Staphylococcus sp. 17KM0847]|uniref:SepA family multidrug efflux transporter n=1 Tax=Staphylococcus sp. 17KM0847 TaxID=2583989 RepID=UPI0027E3E692|nr:SepA family multidrug efflux transporter [Staphylococcus sp. 17KM0847]
MRGNFNWISLLVVLSIFIVSGALFLVVLALGLYGVSRILIMLNLGTFEYNQGFYDNLLYYGSYIILGYFLIFCIEFIMDVFRKKLATNPYFQGITFHLITYTLMVILFFFMIHIHYDKIQIDYWVIMLIIAFLYLCKEIFYPNSKNLNKHL